VCGGRGGYVTEDMPFETLPMGSVSTLYNSVTYVNELESIPFSWAILQRFNCTDFKMTTHFCLVQKLIIVELYLHHPMASCFFN
jgi:hypothetical protein